MHCNSAKAVSLLKHDDSIGQVWYLTCSWPKADEREKDGKLIGRAGTPQ